MFDGLKAILRDAWQDTVVRVIVAVLVVAFVLFVVLGGLGKALGQ